MRAALGTAAGVGLVGAASLLEACGGNPAGSGDPGVTVPNQASGVYSFAFSSYSELQSAGGSRIFTVSATSGTKRVAVTRVSAGVARTVLTTCTHAGCSIGSYNSSAQQYTCPCHGSVFNSDGSVNTGPASTALTAFSSTVTGSGIDVTIP